MTRATFFQRGALLAGVSIAGHAGYAQAGRDIVCSAISAVSHMTALGLCEVMGLRVQAEAADGDVQILVDEADLTAAQPMLRTLEKELQAIHDQYPDHIRIGYQERREFTCFS